MEDETNGDSNKIKNKKINIKKTGGGFILVLMFIVVAYSTRPSPQKEESPTDTSNEIVDEDRGDSDSDIIIDDSPEYVDERPKLEEGTLESLKDEVYELASQGKLNDLIVMLDKYDKEFDLEKNDDGMHLKNIYWDATVVARLMQMGDDENAVIAGTEKIPYLKTLEMYIWALYFLPRNNIVDMSIDSLALAPTARGQIEITNIVNSQNNEELHNEIIEDEHIKYYTNTIDWHNDYDNGFFKIDLLNYGVEETVYGVIDIDEKFNLIGIYSNDPYYSNHVETVSHFRQFSESVGAGLDKFLEEEERKMTDERREREDELNEIDQ